MRSVVLAWLLAGCSFAFVNKPPEHATAPSDCTESRTAPTVDAVLATGLLAGGIVAMTSNSSCDSSQQDCAPSEVGTGIVHGAGIVMVLSSLVFIASAGRGYSATGACRRLHETTDRGALVRL